MNGKELYQGTAQQRLADLEAANVVEIYPGATAELAVGSSRDRRSRQRRFGAEAGMATAEYAIATLAAVGFAGLLVVILRSEEVRGFLMNIIRTALSF